MLWQERALCYLRFPYAHQHDACLLVGVARAVDFIQAKQGGAHQETCIDACIGQGNDDAAIVLRVLTAERIGLDEYLDGIAYAILDAQLLSASRYKARC